MINTSSAFDRVHVPAHCRRRARIREQSNELTFAFLPSPPLASQVAAIVAKKHIKKENVWTMDEKGFMIGLSKTKTLLVWKDPSRRSEKKRTPKQVQGELSFVVLPSPPVPLLVSLHTLIDLTTFSSQPTLSLFTLRLYRRKPRARNCRRMRLCRWSIHRTSHHHEGESAYTLPGSETQPFRLVLDSPLRTRVTSTRS